MNTLDSYVLNDILLWCPDSITQLGMTNKYYYDFVMSDDVLKGLYKYPPSETSYIKDIFEHFEIKNYEKLCFEIAAATPYFIPIEEIYFRKIRYAEIYAITSNNTGYLEYLQTIGCGFCDVYKKNESIWKDVISYNNDELTIFMYTQIALFINNWQIVKKFYKLINDNDYKRAHLAFYLTYEQKIAHMVRVSRYHIDSLKYALSKIDFQIDFDDFNMLNNYFNVITYGSVDCATLIYHMIPKQYLNGILHDSLYEDCDEILENIKNLHDIGYIFANDEFDSVLTHDNVETLKYLISINYHITGDRLEKWKKNPKCKEYLENEMLQ